MTVSEFYHRLEARLPRELCAPWDHDGLACAPNPEAPVRRVLVTLDVTDAAVTRAIEGGFDVILSHHPLLFRGIGALVPDAAVPRKLLRLAGAGIAAMAFHTRLDATKGGVNDVLAALFGLQNVTPFGEEPACGRVGDLPCAVEAEAFAALVKEKLGVKAVLLSGGGTVRRVAVLGGEGGDFLEAAKETGADLFLSGRIGYHRMLDAPEEGIITVEAGHYATEAPVCARLVALAAEVDAAVETEIFRSAAIRTV